MALPLTTVQTYSPRADPGLFSGLWNKSLLTGVLFSSHRVDSLSKASWVLFCHLAPMGFYCGLGPFPVRWPLSSCTHLLKPWAPVSHGRVCEGDERPSACRPQLGG